MFFIIVGSFVLELVTIMESHLIKCKSIPRTICIYGKKGYKVDHELVNAFFQNELKRQKNAHWLKKLITNLLFWVPIVNMLQALIKSYYLSYKFQKNGPIKASLIPMTFEEKMKYNNTDHLFQKAGFASYIKSPKNTITELKYDALPVKYTLAEVERLSNAMQGKYRLGVFQDQNIAIIGISDLENIGREISLNQKKGNLETLPDHYLDSFTVYPYSEDYHDNVALQTCMESIQIKKDGQNSYFITDTKMKGKSRHRVKCH